MSFPDISLPLADDVDAQALRAAIDAAGSSIERMQQAMNAGEDLTGPAAYLAVCQFRLRSVLGRAVQ